MMFNKIFIWKIRLITHLTIWEIFLFYIITFEVELHNIEK